MTAPNFLDILAKSAFFHAKLHEWGLLEISQQIEQIPGETLPWDIQELKISQTAWNKIIHRGIKPILIFTHPQVLLHLPAALNYYQLLAMVPKTALNSLQITNLKPEINASNKNKNLALTASQYLNTILSLLVESDAHINPREFDLWRGMAAGAQAQSAWHKSHGSKAELLIHALIRRRLWEQNWVSVETPDKTRLVLNDRRIFLFGNKLNILIYQENHLLAIIGISEQSSTISYLESIKKTCQSLQDYQQNHPQIKTFLILELETLSSPIKTYFKKSNSKIEQWFLLPDILQNEDKKQEFFQKLEI